MYSEQDIRQLLDRFMDGQTSVKDEQAIGEWFATHNKVADDLEEYRQMFAYFAEGMPLGKDGQMRDMIWKYHPRTLHIKREVVIMLAAACVVLVLLMTTNFLKLAPQSGNAQVASTMLVDSASCVSDEGKLPTSDVGNVANSKSIRKVQSYRHIHSLVPQLAQNVEPGRQICQDSLSDAVDGIVAKCVEEARSENEESFRQVMMSATVYENAIIEEALVAALEDVY